MRRPCERMPPKLVQREPCQRRRRSLVLGLAKGELEKRSSSPQRSMRKMSWTFIYALA